MTTKARNWLIAIFIVAFPFTLFMGFLIFLKTEPGSVFPPLPNPNGYDDFLAAGKAAISDDTLFYRKMNERELQDFIDSNSNTLQRAYAGLQKQCAVPVQFTESYISNHLEYLGGLKMTARALAAEGRLAELKNQPVDAAKHYLEVIRFGQQCQRGGVLIDGLVGIAIEYIGTDHLESLMPQLDANTCRETAARLEEMDSTAQTFDDVMRQENAWSHAVYRGWRYEFIRFQTRASIAKATASSETKFDDQKQREQKLLVELAARAYQLDKGHPLAAITDLVPDYLKAIPQDPVTGTNIVYSP